MKKWICVLLCLVMAGVSVFSALAEEITDVMQVYNCNEWVSLRVRADASSKRLAKVPLGDMVSGCEKARDGFIKCEYQGQTGYIQAKYLTPVWDFDALAGRVTYDNFQKVGHGVAEFSAGGNLVSVRRLINTNAEILHAALFDQNGQYLSSLEAGVDEPGQYDRLTAFQGGTADAPCLVWYAEDVISAYTLESPLEDHQLWALALDESQTIGSGVAHAVDTDGTIYLIGYEWDALTRISPAGEIVWQASHVDDEVFGAYKIDLLPDSVLVTYEEKDAVVTYNKEDGAVISTAIPTGETGLGEAPEEMPDETPDETPKGTRPVVMLGPDEEEEAVTTVSLPGMMAMLTEDRLGDCIEFVASEEEPQVTVLFLPLRTVTDFKVLSLSVRDWDFSDAGAADDAEESAEPDSFFDYEVLHTEAELTSDQSLLVTMTFLGDMPNNGISYVDANGNLHRYTVELSGMNGSLLLSEF